MHPCALDDAIDDVAWAAQADSDKVEILSGHHLDGGAVGFIVPRREQLASVDTRAQVTRESLGACGREYVGRAGEDHDRLPAHGEVAVSVGVPVGLSDDAGIAADDAAGQERGDVQLLPRQQALAEKNDDLRVEADGRGLSGVGHASSVEGVWRSVLYVSCMETVRAWHPKVPLVREVLTATFERHAYPAHTHDAWTVLFINEGAVAYTLDGASHHAVPATITLLPPHVPHDGRTAERGRPFRKRVLYLEESWLATEAIGAAVARPLMAHSGATRILEGIHRALRVPGDEMAAESGILALGTVAREHLGGAVATATDAPLARKLRAMLDDRYSESFTITDAARALGVHPSHLVRVFSAAYGIPPHRYVTARRVDRARRLLGVGRPAAAVAAEVGFHDQAHMNRHFRRVLGTTPGAFAP